jgi:O-glycosyl hydrolase
LLKVELGFELWIGALSYAIGVQNNPQNSNPTYPKCLFDVDDEGAVGTKLHSLLNGSGLDGTKIVGYEHIWVKASTYPVDLVRRGVFK